MEVREGHATNRPPLFEETDYSYWKMRMKYYIQSVDYQCWECIESGDYTTTLERISGPLLIMLVNLEYI